MSARLLDLAKQLQAATSTLNKNKELAENMIKNTMEAVKDIDPIKAKEFEAQANHIINTAKNGGDFTSLFAKYSQKAKEVKND